jgi:hypothetical protein
MNLRIDLGVITMACGHTIALRVPVAYGLSEQDVQRLRERWERSICLRCEWATQALVMREEEESEG